MSHHPTSDATVPADPVPQTLRRRLMVVLATQFALLMGVALSRVVKARRNPVEVGVTQLVGDDAVVRREGWVAVGGELWRARTPDGRPLVPGEHVTVESVEDDLGLVVGSQHPTERA